MQVQAEEEVEATRHRPGDVDGGRSLAMLNKELAS
jgi:hypothetical protein